MVSAPYNSRGQSNLEYVALVDMWQPVTSLFVWIWVIFPFWTFSAYLERSLLNPARNFLLSLQQLLPMPTTASAAATLLLHQFRRNLKTYLFAQYSVTYFCIRGITRNYAVKSILLSHTTEITGVSRGSSKIILSCRLLSIICLYV